MYKTNKQLKQEAKQALSGKWGVAVLMTLLTTVITYSLSTGKPESIVVTVTSLIATLLNVILSVGLLSFFFKICCGQKNLATFKDLFFGFHCHPGKALLLYLLTILYLLPGTFVYLILVFAGIFALLAGSGISAGSFLQNGIPIESGIATGVLLIFFLCTVLYFIYAVYIETTYCLIYYLLLDYPDLSVSQIWKRSAQLMKGNRWRKFKLDLSFFLWIFASLFTLLIGLLWVSVYMQATYTEFYLDIVQQQAAKNPSIAASSQENAYTEIYQSGIDPNTFQ